MGNHRTWSEIKLKNPSAEVCRELSRILDLLEESTAPKALERIILAYLPDWERERMLDGRIAELKQEIANLNLLIAERDAEMANIREVYLRFHELIGFVGFSAK